MKNIKWFILVGILTFTFNSYGQRYQSAIGLRFGFPTTVGVDFKHNFDNHWAIDAGFGFRKFYFGLDVQGLYHFPISSVPGLRPYVGAALDIGLTHFPKSYYYYDDYWVDAHGKVHYNNGYHDYGRTHLVLGLSVLGGIEYTFKDVPINLSLGVGPRLPIFPWGNYYWTAWYWRGNFAVRYTF